LKRVRVKRDKEGRQDDTLTKAETREADEPAKADDDQRKGEQGTKP
jgi:hypothetical protein